MSMTREKAIALFEKQLTAAQVVLDSGFGGNPGENDFLYRRRKEMAEIALTALRPISRERVEKVWRGEWREEIVNKCDWKGKKREYYQPHSCSKCHRADPGEGKSKFCPHCGAPMTDEAVDIVMKRLETLHEHNA